MSFARDPLISLVDEGPGNSAYLADPGDGCALAVGASRDPRALREAAARRGLRVALAAGTHLDADFRSGATQLATDDRAVRTHRRRRDWSAATGRPLEEDS